MRPVEAEWAHAEPALVAAAFLHDVGHFLAAEAVARNDHLDDEHKPWPCPAVRSFGPAVTRPSLARAGQALTSSAWTPTTSSASRPPPCIPLAPLQGGTLSREECAAAQNPAPRLRLCGAAAWSGFKTPGRPTPSL